MNKIEQAIETDIDAAIEQKQGEKCMACETGQIDEYDFCDYCGCVMVA